MATDVIDRLRARGVQPSAQRVAVAEYVLSTLDHPSADQVLNAVQKRFPLISRATVYNTLNLFVREGLLRAFVLTEGRVVFDPKVEPHHHLIDRKTGAIEDIPWELLEVKGIAGLRGFEIEEYQVVLRGRRSRAAKRSR